MQTALPRTRDIPWAFICDWDVFGKKTASHQSGQKLKALARSLLHAQSLTMWCIVGSHIFQISSKEITSTRFEASVF